MLASAVIAAAIVIDNGMIVPRSDLLGLALLTGGLLGGQFWVVQRKLSQRLGLLFSGFGLLLPVSFTAGIIAHVGLRYHRPLVDPLLAAADRALLIDTPRWVTAFSRNDAVISALLTAYNSTVPVVLLSAAGLALARQPDRLWELTYAYAAAITLCALIYVAYPAVGNIAYLAIPADQMQGLPGDAGRFHLSAFDYYRNGASPVVELRRFNGIVTFPSFHTVMAILVARGWRGTGPLGWIAMLWAALVIVSTVPIGGHYVVDLLGGAVLWAALTLLGGTLIRRGAPA